MSDASDTRSSDAGHIESGTTEHGPVLTVPGMTREAFRRSILIAIVVGVVGLVVGGAIWGGVGAATAAFGCLGLALGAANSLLTQRAVLRQTAAETPSRAVLVRGAGARLGIITLVAVGLALLFFPSGLGTFIGLALFQAVNTIAGALPALKELRR